MQSLSNYERLLQESQSLKKHLQAEKMAHQNTLKQLQNAYQLNDQMKGILKKEQDITNKLKVELQNAQERLVDAVTKYETQIDDVKQLINMKDQELRRLASTLVLNDYDVIRLRIVNQLQNNHQSELNALNGQIQKQAIELGELRKANNVLLDKNSLLVEQVRRSEEHSLQKTEQSSQKYIKELNSIYEDLQVERNSKRALTKLNDNLRRKVESLSEYYKGELAEMQNQLDQERQQMKDNGGHAQKHKITRLEAELTNLRSEVKGYKESEESCMQQISNLKREKNEGKKREIQLERKIDHLTFETESVAKELKERETSIKQLKKQVDSLQKQISANDSELNHELRKQLSNLKEQLYQAKSANVFLKNSLQYQGQDQDLQARTRKFSGKATAQQLQRHINQKDLQINKLHQQLNELSATNTLPRRVSEHRPSEDTLKSKLRQANETILNLLKDKIALKQTINELHVR